VIEQPNAETKREVRRHVVGSLWHPRVTVALWQHGEKEIKEKALQKEACAEA